MRLLLLLSIISLTGCSVYMPGRGSVSTQTVDTREAVDPLTVDTPYGPVYLPPGVVYSISFADVLQPTPADSSASIVMDGKGGIDVYTGSGGEFDELLGVVSPWISLVLGIGIFLFGGVIWLAQKRTVGLAGGGIFTILARTLPKRTGLLCMGLGPVVAILPWFLATYGWVIPVTVIGLIIALAIRYFHNLNKADIQLQNSNAIKPEVFEKGK